MWNGDVRESATETTARFLRALTNFGLPIGRVKPPSQNFHQCDMISTRQSTEPALTCVHNKQQRGEECHARARAGDRRAVRHVFRQPHDRDQAYGTVLRISDGRGCGWRGDAVCGVAFDRAARICDECSDKHIGVLAHEHCSAADRETLQPIYVLRESSGGPRQQFVQVGAKRPAINPGFFRDCWKLLLADLALSAFPPRHGGARDAQFLGKGALCQIPDFAISRERMFDHKPYVTDLVTIGQEGAIAKCDRVGQ